MKLNDAIVKRIDEIYLERGSNVCDISLNWGMSPSAIYDIIKGRTQCSKVITIKRFCEGAGMTLYEFFDRDYFNEPEENWMMKTNKNIFMIVFVFHRKIYCKIKISTSRCNLWRCRRNIIWPSIWCGYDLQCIPPFSKSESTYWKSFKGFEIRWNNQYCSRIKQKRAWWNPYEIGRQSFKHLTRMWWIGRNARVLFQCRY